VDEFDAEYLVINRLAAGELDKHLTPKDREDYGNMLRDRGRLVIGLWGDLINRTYTFIDVWKVD
jgi:hypothetical protein